jgi:hypothetical protein
MESGAFAITEHNKDNDPKPLLPIESPLLRLIGNIMYNFDNFPQFSNDQRVKSTITDRTVAQSDFMYVMEKITDSVREIVEIFNKEKEVSKNEKSN